MKIVLRGGGLSEGPPISVVFGGRELDWDSLTATQQENVRALFVIDYPKPRQMAGRA